MCALIFECGDMRPMHIIRPAAGEGHLYIDEAAALSAFEDCLALIRRENPAVVVFKFIYTVTATHKLELYYSLRGEDEISPMGIVTHVYESLERFRECMYVHFTGLEFPL